MRNALLLTRNTLKLIFRKKGQIMVSFLLPVLGLLISLGLYSSIGANTVKVGIVDKDKSIISGDFVKSLRKEENFKVTVIDEREINSQITSGKVDCVLTIPEGFADSTYHQNITQMEIVSIKGEAATAWIQNYTNIYLSNLRDIGMAAGGNQQTFAEIYSNLQADKLSLQENKVQDRTKNMGMTSQSIGFLIMFMILGAGSTAELIFREKRNRTYYRILQTPVSSRTFVAGNVLANLVIVLVQVALTIFLMTKVFGIETFIPFLQLYLILVLFGLVAIGLGLLIVTFSDDSRQADTFQTLIITPTCMLAGCFWPLDIMPKPLQHIADFLPQKWALTAIQKLQESGDFNRILINLSIILGFALAFFLIAAYRFSRNDNVKAFI